MSTHERPSRQQSNTRTSNTGPGAMQGWTPAATVGPVGKGGGLLSALTQGPVQLKADRANDETAAPAANDAGVTVQRAEDDLQINEVKVKREAITSAVVVNTPTDWKIHLTVNMPDGSTKHLGEGKCKIKDGEPYADGPFLGPTLDVNAEFFSFADGVTRIRGDGFRLTVAFLEELLARFKESFNGAEPGHLPGNLTQSNLVALQTKFVELSKSAAMAGRGEQEIALEAIKLTPYGIGRTAIGYTNFTIISCPIADMTLQLEETNAAGVKQVVPKDVRAPAACLVDCTR